MTMKGMRPWMLLAAPMCFGGGEVAGAELPFVDSPSDSTEWTRKGFVSLLNPAHPGNRIGYRFFEHVPFVHGEIGPAADQTTEEAEALEKQYASRPGVHVHGAEVTDKSWAKQNWTFYIAPRSGGFDLLWVVAAGEVGLNEFYVAQQCFRMSGKTNREWRQKIALTPAFSEYDHWAEQEASDEARTSLSHVRRNGRWEALPAVDEHVVCRTPAGVTMDTGRSGGDMSRIDGMAPYDPSQFLPDVDCGMATRADKDGRWNCGLFWERATHVSNHHPADCLHLFVNLGPLSAHGKRAIRGRIYWMEGSKDDLFARWEEEFGGG